MFQNLLKSKRKELGEDLGDKFNVFELFLCAFFTPWKHDIILVGGTNVISIATGKLDESGKEEIIDVRAEHIPLSDENSLEVKNFNRTFDRGVVFTTIQMHPDAEPHDGGQGAASGAAAFSAMIFSCVQILLL